MEADEVLRVAAAQHLGEGSGRQGACGTEVADQASQRVLSGALAKGSESGLQLIRQLVYFPVHLV